MQPHAVTPPTHPHTCHGAARSDEHRCGCHVARKASAAPAPWQLQRFAHCPPVRHVPRAATWYAHRVAPAPHEARPPPDPVALDPPPPRVPEPATTHTASTSTVVSHPLRTAAWTSKHCARRSSGCHAWLMACWAGVVPDWCLPCHAATSHLGEYCPARR